MDRQRQRQDADGDADGDAHGDEQVQRMAQHFASSYPIELRWPAAIVVGSSSSSGGSRRIRRTADDIIHHRLVEAGVLFDVPTPLSQLVQTTSEFVQDLEKTGCYQSVRVEIGGSGGGSGGNVDDGDDATTRKDDSQSGQQQQQQSAQQQPKLLKVVLDEANWYRLHAGGGLKTDFLLNSEQASSVNQGFLPAAEVEASVKLRNLTGLLDATSLQYSVDTKSVTTWSFEHERPLFAALPASSFLRDAVLSLPTGSRYSAKFRAGIDTSDYEYTRSYKEFRRLLSATASNAHSVARSDQTPDPYCGVEWTVAARDVVPRRHATVPYALDASPEIASQAGPNFANLFRFEYRTNGRYLDRPTMPTNGYEVHGTAECATPPGDVGFLKVNGGLSAHRRMPAAVAFHGAFNAGYVRHLSFGGLCPRPPTPSDRFYVGGPFSFRGFSPAGIGPRAAPSSSSSGAAAYADALGGDFYYTATAMASVAPNFGYFSGNGGNGTNGGGGPSLAGDSQPQPPQPPPSSPVRLFGFVTVGTCVGCFRKTPLAAIAQSSRAAAGIGLTTALFGPKLELTWSWPLRYDASKDVRKQFQFGMGFQFE